MYENHGSQTASQPAGSTKTVHIPSGGGCLDFIFTYDPIDGPPVYFEWPVRRDSTRLESTQPVHITQPISIQHGHPDIHYTVQDF